MNIHMQIVKIDLEKKFFKFTPHSIQSLGLSFMPYFTQNPTLDITKLLGFTIIISGTAILCSTHLTLASLILIHSILELTHPNSTASLYQTSLNELAHLSLPLNFPHSHLLWTIRYPHFPSSFSQLRHSSQTFHFLRNIYLFLSLSNTIYSSYIPRT